MVIGVVSMRLLIPGAHSLKEKRSPVKGLKERLRHRFNASVAEVDDHDLHGQAVIACAVVGNDKRFVNSCLSEIVEFARRAPDTQFVDYELEFI